MTSTKITSSQSLPEMVEQVEALWLRVHALPRVGGIYDAGFDQFETVLRLLNTADVEPCPVTWCDQIEAHSWVHQLHHPEADRVGRSHRTHRHCLTDKVAVELFEPDSTVYASGLVEPGEARVAVENVDLLSPEQVEEHINVLREAARLAFGEATR